MKKFKSTNGKTYHIPTVIANMDDGIIASNDLPFDVLQVIDNMDSQGGRVISGQIVRDTAKAICFAVVGDDSIFGDVWFPKSQIIAISQNSIKVTDWIYSQKAGA